MWTSPSAELHHSPTDCPLGKPRAYAAAGTNKHFRAVLTSPPFNPVLLVHSDVREKHHHDNTSESLFLTLLPLTPGRTAAELSVWQMFVAHVTPPH